MKPIQNAGGHVLLAAREYPITAATTITVGQVVKLSGGKVVAGTAAQSTAILGIAAETHSGVADDVNTRSNGTVILVYDNPELIFECPAPEVTADTSSVTTMVAASGEIAATINDDAFNGGAVQLLSKAAGSTNTDVPGQLRAVTDYAKTGTTLTIASGGAAVAGDVYRIYPPVGSKVMGLDSDISAAIVSATGATAIKVVGHDYERGKIRLMAAKHALGVGE